MPRLTMFFLAITLPILAQVSLEIEHDRVTAQDLARVLPQWKQVPPETSVLYAPLPGLSREVTGAELARLARRHEAPEDAASPWPERLRIVRRVRRLEREEALAALVSS